MYYKRCTGTIPARESDVFPDWVRWTHHIEGKTHFDPENFYQHGKNREFESWGYTVSDAQCMISFITGWMAKPSGQLSLNTPYGGK